ncbi:hypothetical protein OH77DRAFT_50390 [Trametes cingulata]|nr:hypothetical protein OH77DRAFT_50390 [Trametes cingulata]
MQCFHSTLTFTFTFTVTPASTFHTFRVPTFTSTARPAAPSPRTRLTSPYHVRIPDWPSQVFVSFSFPVLQDDYGRAPRSSCLLADPFGCPTSPPSWSSHRPTHRIRVPSPFVLRPPRRLGPCLEYCTRRCSLARCPVSPSCVPVRSVRPSVCPSLCTFNVIRLHLVCSPSPSSFLHNSVTTRHAPLSTQTRSIDRSCLLAVFARCCISSFLLSMSIGSRGARVCVGTRTAGLRADASRSPLPLLMMMKESFDEPLTTLLSPSPIPSPPKVLAFRSSESPKSPPWRRLIRAAASVSVFASRCTLHTCRIA